MALDDFCLDVFGQQPQLNIYTQVCFCFSVADVKSHPAIIKTLTDGLDRLSASFPWAVGQIVNDGDSKTVAFKIKPLEKIPLLMVKDYTQDSSMLTMDELRRTDFPMSMLGEELIAPRKTLQGLPGDPVPESTPVFLLQASFIRGGLILTILGHHQAMDMTGQMVLIDLLSKACHNGQFTSEELSIGNEPRKNIIPLLTESEQSESTVSSQDSTRAEDPIPPSFPPSCSWANFSFSGPSLVALKAAATKTIPIATTFVSTDDTLSAFIWQSVARCRLPRLNSEEKGHLCSSCRPT
jgi:trichothecene 3-O-acetyltransferase